MGVKNVQELISAMKKAHKEKRFSNKVIRLVKDVEGKKPDSLKDCWRWIRGLLHDFVTIKKSFSD